MEINNRIVLYDNKAKCCGCMACYATCSQGAILMVEDEEGFEYPRIDYKLCISCGRCISVCPIKEANNHRV